MWTSKALSNLQFTGETERAYILEVFYLSEGLAFIIFSIVYFYFYGFLKVKIEQKQT